MKYLKVIEGSEVQEALHSLPELSTLVRSLYECHYDQFFISLGEYMSHTHTHTHYLLLAFFNSMDRGAIEERLLPCSTHTILLERDADYCLHAAVSVLPIPITTTHGTSIWC